MSAQTPYHHRHVCTNCSTGFQCPFESLLSKKTHCMNTVADLSQYCLTQRMSSCARPASWGNCPPPMQLDVAELTMAKVGNFPIWSGHLLRTMESDYFAFTETPGRINRSRRLAWSATCQLRVAARWLTTTKQAMTVFFTKTGHRIRLHGAPIMQLRLHATWMSVKRGNENRSLLHSGETALVIYVTVSRCKEKPDIFVDFLEDSTKRCVPFFEDHNHLWNILATNPTPSPSRLCRHRVLYRLCFNHARVRLQLSRSRNRSYSNIPAV